MSENDCLSGSTEACAQWERLRTGPHKPSPDDRIYVVRIKMLGVHEMMTPHLRTKLARAGELTSLEHDGEWETVRLRSSKVMATDLKRMADDNGYAIKIINQAL